MTSSLVGSEMCIRDSCCSAPAPPSSSRLPRAARLPPFSGLQHRRLPFALAHLTYHPGLEHCPSP
eukprot:441103-Prorocentrum_lima.AAC.1